MTDEAIVGRWRNYKDGYIVSRIRYEDLSQISLNKGLLSATFIITSKGGSEIKAPGIAKEEAEELSDLIYKLKDIERPEERVSFFDLIKPNQNINEPPIEVSSLINKAEEEVHQTNFKELDSPIERPDRRSNIILSALIVCAMSFFIYQGLTSDRESVVSNVSELSELDKEVAHKNANYKQKFNSQTGNKLPIQSPTSGDVAVMDVASNWYTYSSDKKINFVREAAQASACKESWRCDSRELMLCMDEVSEPPVPDRLLAMTIGELAARCVAAYSI